MSWFKKEAKEYKGIDNSNFFQIRNVYNVKIKTIDFAQEASRYHVLVIGENNFIFDYCKVKKIYYNLDFKIYFTQEFLEEYMEKFKQDIINELNKPTRL